MPAGDPVLEVQPLPQANIISEVLAGHRTALRTQQEGRGRLASTRHVRSVGAGEREPTRNLLNRAERFMQGRIDGMHHAE